jgi:RimJ/RimL family protein N-acetyltransferase
MESVRFNDLGQPIGFEVPDWAPPSFPPHSAIAGRYCRLEPLSLAHAPALWEVFSEDRDGRNWTYLANEPFAAAEAFEAYVMQSAASIDPQFYAILVDGTAAGIASYLRITPAAGSIEVGHIHFSPRLQQTPAATEAMYLMMRRAFELGYRRYEWKCDALNAPSRRAAQRLGFSFEGVFRQALVTKGRNRDTAWYACIDKEWPALRAAFETWLQPDNFDAAGRQRLSLSALTSPLLVKRG